MWVRSREEYDPHKQPTVTLLTFSARTHSYLLLRANRSSPIRSVGQFTGFKSGITPSTLFSLPLIGMHESPPVMSAYEVR